ncbi:MAG: hypothetical protein SFY69_07390 [Planctomycetota bacterium]|nr:hypothetical protein [Planctomycetota bacterium]
MVAMRGGSGGGATGGPGQIVERAGSDRRAAERARLADAARLAAGYLEPRDRAILEGVYVHGHTCADLARLMGEPRQARTLRRRLRRLTALVVAPEFGFVLRQQSAWPTSRRAVARAIFLRGRSVREAAAELGITQHAVRRQRDAVLALVESIGGRVGTAPVPPAGVDASRGAPALPRAPRRVGGAA